MCRQNYPASLLVLCLLLLIPISGVSQDQKKKKKGGIPKGRYLNLRTQDGINLRCAYYESARAEENGKEVVPVMLIHGWKQKSSDFHGLAIRLQRAGHTVIVPDLRGHGRSLSRKNRRGQDEEISYEKMKPVDKKNVWLDVQAVKVRLWQEHNEGLLNLERLCVVGAREGAMIALDWAAREWSVRDLATGIKRGKNIKALVLLSPKPFMRYTAQAAFRNPVVQQQLSMMIAVGNADRKAFAESQKLYRRLEGKRDKLPEDPQEAQKKRTLYFAAADTDLQGTGLTVGPLRIADYVADFIRWRIVSHAEEYPWEERRFP